MTDDALLDEFMDRNFRRFNRDGTPWLKYGASPGGDAGDDPPDVTPDRTEWRPPVIIIRLTIPSSLQPTARGVKTDPTPDEGSDR